MADARTDAVESRPDEHSWGETRHDAVSSQAVGPGPPTDPRSGPSAAVVVTALCLLMDTSEDGLMGSFEQLRLKSMGQACRGLRMRSTLRRLLQC